MDKSLEQFFEQPDRAKLLEQQFNARAKRISHAFIRRYFLLGESQRKPLWKNPVFLTSLLGRSPKLRPWQVPLKHAQDFNGREQALLVVALDVPVATLRTLCQQLDTSLRDTSGQTLAAQTGAVGHPSIAQANISGQEPELLSDVAEHAPVSFVDAAERVSSLLTDVAGRVPVLLTNVADFAFYSQLGWLVEYVPEPASAYGQAKLDYLALRYQIADKLFVRSDI